jgi:uncharacterized protein YqcC (DUF446 family)
MGIEPTSSAWEAEVMPLYDTRITFIANCGLAPQCNWGARVSRSALRVKACGLLYRARGAMMRGAMMRPSVGAVLQARGQTDIFAMPPGILPGNTYSMHTEVAAVLIDIEAQLRQLGLWDNIPPSTDALASNEPFCVDTLTLPQWLQFVFLPAVYQMVEQEQQLPARCGIAPMAEEFFRGSGLAIDQLVVALLHIDELLSESENDG